MWIDRLIRLVLPRQDLFFTLLEGLAAKMTVAAAVFGELATASNPDQLAAISLRLKPIETQADHLCHQLYEQLDRSFVTPIDREDLAELTSALDDVIESIRETTVAVHTLENEADAVYRTAIAALFGDGIDSRELIRQKDMLFCLEDGVDQCEDAMDVIRSVVVKNG